MHEPEPEEFAEFLQKDDAVGLILTIDPDEGSLFGDIGQRVNVSQTTLSSRIEEAERMELIVRSRHPDDHGNAKRYFVSPVADFYRVKMEEAGVADAYEQYLESQERIAEGIEKIGNYP